MVFDPAIDTELFMQCTGGWDWAPYSNTTTKNGNTATFSRGIWKSVYMVYLEDGLAVTDTTPLVKYGGPFPTQPLSDGNHGHFILNLTMQTMAVKAISANLTIQPSWSTTPLKGTLNAPAGMGTATVMIDVRPEEIQLWWPTGMGAQPLYDVDIFISTAAVKTPLHIQRRIGFRYFAIVTGNDTDDAYVQQNADVDGTDTMGMRFRINGAPIFARGANIIPMDNMEGRYTAAAHRRMVWNARDGGMNIMRIWGGGVYLPSIFYATADEVGVMVYHDQMNRDYFTGLQDEVRAYRSQLRRLAPHPSIVIWDGCNECDANQGEIGTTVMSIVTDEDSSRAIWPSCPAQGWRSGVGRLSSHPDGQKLNPAPAASADVNALGRIEQHGPYQHGDGWPAVNGDNNNANAFDPMLPLDELNHEERIGLQYPNLFTSEFGSVGWSSFESVAPTVASEHWALHGGAAPDDCNDGGWPSKCKGDNVMSQRNYPCDSIIFQYFGGTSADLDVVGEMPFKKQLYQCLMGQALVLRGYIEQHRATNTYGLQIWQLNEIWPTGGWGTIEYGTTEVMGQVEGGRWKPAHYWLKDYLFTDRIITCGKGRTDNTQLCYIRNDAFQGMVGNALIYAIDLTNSHITPHFMQSGISLASGPGAVQWLDIPAVANPNSTVLRAVFIDSVTSEVVARTTILFTTPQFLTLSPVQLSVRVSSSVNKDASVDITIAKKADSPAAVWVTLTTMAQGRFSDNSFIMAENEVVVQFIPFGALDTVLLRKSLRVETANDYATTAQPRVAVQ